MNDEELKKRLKDLRLPDADEAEERGWQTVRAAFEEHEVESPAPGARPSRRPAGGLLAASLALVAAVLVITPAGASVRNWVGDVFDGRDLGSSKVVNTIPGGGRLLVDTPEGTWVTDPGGPNRLLGDFTDSTWSPRGLFVAAVDGNQLVAMEPDGTTRWVLGRPGEISLPEWKAPDGYRIAYLEGNHLRVVAGDGTGDRLLARRAAPVQPAWRPGPANLVAYVNQDHGVELVQTDTGTRSFSYSHMVPRGLEWSKDGTRLLAWDDEEAVLLDLSGRTRWRYRPASGRSIDSAALGPGVSNRVVVLEGNTRTRVVLAAPGQKTGVLFTAPGNLEDPVWSPDGDRLNLGWPDADQWLFLHGRELRKIDVVAGVSRRFSPGETSAESFPEVRGWCCQH